MFPVYVWAAQKSKYLWGDTWGGSPQIPKDKEQQCVKPWAKKKVWKLVMHDKYTQVSL